MRHNSLLLNIVTLVSVLIVSTSVQAQTQRTAADAMDQIVTRLYATMTPEELTAITVNSAETLITSEERHLLATGHWSFETNVPVVVSIMRSIRQKTAPFWLLEQEFE
ncbi:MAG: hypothetical protein MK102_19430, partial [Fuerstiella sp.]|nr:hypothetical protein [Fuerstiella sp.]